MYKIAHDWRHWALYAAALIFMPLALAGCTLTQSAFARKAGNAGAAFAAAATTLDYAHHGRLTAAYAAASFVAYQSELSGLDRQLSSAVGAPDARDMRRLIALYDRAMPAVDRPCLRPSCGWQAQLAALRQASASFNKAGGG